MSLGYLACAGALAIALVVLGHLLWRRQLYALAVLAAFTSAVSVFCLVVGGMMNMVGVPR